MFRLRLVCILFDKLSINSSSSFLLDNLSFLIFLYSSLFFFSSFVGCCCIEIIVIVLMVSFLLFYLFFLFRLFFLLRCISLIIFSPWITFFSLHLFSFLPTLYFIVFFFSFSCLYCYDFFSGILFLSRRTLVFVFRCNLNVLYCFFRMVTSCCIDCY